MRELKFRIWNGTRFVTKADTYIKTSNGSLWDYEEDCGGTFSSNKILKDYEEDYGGNFSSNKKLWSADGKIQQYTGLKDRNGKEIYEGDIVHYVFDGASHPKEAQNKYLTCVYDPDFGLFCFDDADSSYYWAEIRGYVEVVGNIFENSELLKP